MKKLHLLLLLTGMLVLLAWVIPPQKKTLLLNIQPKLLGTITSELAQPENQDEKYSMKPAWYRYFNIHTPDKFPHQSGLQFIFQTEQNLQGFINFKLVNTTSENISIRIQNGSLIMIQEAQNEKGEWQPIEYWDYDWGDGSVFDQLSLDPKKAVLISAPKYQGDFATQIRFKLKIGQSKGTDDVYYSPAFAGTINLSQFKINPEAKDQHVSYLEK